MCPEPDPISNSAVKRTSAHGTVSQDTGESVAARPAQHITKTIPSRRSELAPKAKHPGAGWSSPVARQAHNLKVTGSNPVPATKHQTDQKAPDPQRSGAFCRPMIARQRSRSHRIANETGSLPNPLRSNRKPTSLKEALPAPAEDTSWRSTRTRSTMRFWLSST